MTFSARQWFYAVLAVAGLLGPWYFNINFMLETGFVFDYAEFVRQGFSNEASSSLTVDVIVAAIAFSIWVVHEARRLGIAHGWVYIVLTFAIAFAFAFPLFLLIREGRLRRTEAV